MQLRQRQALGAVVIDFSGDGIGSEPSPLRALVSSLLEKGHRHIVLNLEHLQKLDSTCLAEIVASYKVTAECGGKMNIAAANAHVRRVLQVTKVDTCVKAYESEAEALVSFTSASGARTA